MTNDNLHSAGNIMKSKDTVITKLSMPQFNLGHVKRQVLTYVSSSAFKIFSDTSEWYFKKS